MATTAKERARRRWVERHASLPAVQPCTPCEWARYEQGQQAIDALLVAAELAITTYAAQDFVAAARAAQLAEELVGQSLNPHGPRAC